MPRAFKVATGGSPFLPAKGADLAGYTTVGNLHGGPSTARKGGKWPADLAFFTVLNTVGSLHGIRPEASGSISSPERDRP